MYYETQQMGSSTARAFKEFFDKMIGTDCEENPGDDPDTFYFLCSDLEGDEVEMIRTWESANT
jgi:hypothetical protein